MQLEYVLITFMQKKLKTSRSDSKKKITPPNSESLSKKNNFSHIDHIREIKSKDYIDNLSTDEKDSFDKRLILHGLSMDAQVIENMCKIEKYISILPIKNFYQLCCESVPYGKRYSKWIKSSKPKISNVLINIISKKYEVSMYEATDYCIVLYKSDAGIYELYNLCIDAGYTEPEVGKILEGESI